jgi:hypothetical protein
MVSRSQHLSSIRMWSESELAKETETYQLHTHSRSHGIVDMGFEISAAGRPHSNNGISNIMTDDNKISAPIHIKVTLGFKCKFLNLSSTAFTYSEKIIFTFPIIGTHSRAVGLNSPDLTNALHSI